MPVISGLSMPPEPVTPPPSQQLGRGRKSCQLRGPGAPLRGHQGGNGGLCELSAGGLGGSVGARVGFEGFADELLYEAPDM